MWRTMCWNEQNSVKMELIGGRRRDRQMSIVDRVEGAAEEGESIASQSSPN